MSRSGQALFSDLQAMVLQMIQTLRERGFVIYTEDLSSALVDLVNDHNMVKTYLSEMNLLTYNQSTVEEDTTGFGPIGATLSRDLTEHWEEDASLKVVTDNEASGEGFEIDLTSLVVAGNPFTFFCMVKGSGTVSLNLKEDEVNHQTGGIELTEVWQLFFISITPTQGFEEVYMQLLTTTQEAATFYVDGLMFIAGQSGYAFSPGQLAPAEAGDMVAGKAAFVNGHLVIGTLVN